MQAGLEFNNFERLRCPACGKILAQEAWAQGQRLGRCRYCSNLVRRVTERPWPWPVVPPRSTGESGNSSLDSGATGSQEDYSNLPPTSPVLQVVSGLPALTLPCSYCEHVNRDEGMPQQFCGNCGANLKKTCISCSAPMAVTDYFCPRCGNDQEQAKLQVEAFYWQRYNEGKRQSQLGNWEAVRRELGLFLDTRSNDEYDPLEARRARQLYATAIAPRDGGEGIRLYNEALEHLQKRQQGRRRQKALRKTLPRTILAGLLLLPGLLLAATTGAIWWMLAAPAIIVLLIFLVVVILGSLGLG